MSEPNLSPAIQAHGGGTDFRFLPRGSLWHRETGARWELSMPRPLLLHPLLDLFPSPTTRTSMKTNQPCPQDTNPTWKSCCASQGAPKATPALAGAVGPSLPLPHKHPCAFLGMVGFGWI